MQLVFRSVIIMLSASCFAQVDWSMVSSKPTENNLGFIIYGGGQFVIVGDSGTIITSADGKTWIKSESGIRNDLFCINYNENQYAVVGSKGVILTSSDGVGWISRTSGTTRDLYSVDYGGGQYVVVGSMGTMLTSSDGIVWIDRTSATVEDLSSIAYGNGRFIATARLCLIFTSPDGITWNSGTMGEMTVNYFLTYCNNQFLLLNYFGGGGHYGAVYRSVDGIGWGDMSPGIYDPHYTSIVYGNNQYVLVEKGNIYYSSNGQSWIGKPLNLGFSPKSICYGDSQFVAVGQNGSIITSPAVDIAAEKYRGTELAGFHLSAYYSALHTLNILISGKLLSPSIRISIFNSCGQELSSCLERVVSGKVYVNTPVLSPGVYMVGVESSGFKRYSKFVVAK